MEKPSQSVLLEQRVAQYMLYVLYADVNPPFLVCDNIKMELWSCIACS
jgi:hypothetical protein